MIEWTGPIWPFEIFDYVLNVGDEVVDVEWCIPYLLAMKRAKLTQGRPMRTCHATVMNSSYNSCDILW